MKSSLYFKITFLLVLLSFGQSAKSEKVVFTGQEIVLGNYIETLEDPNDNLTAAQILQSKDFIKSSGNTPNLGFSKSKFWVKITIENNSSEKHILLDLAAPLINSAELYELSADSLEHAESISAVSSFNSRQISHQNYIFELGVPRGGTKTYYLKVSGTEQLVLPLILRTKQGFLEFSLANELLSGIHIGVLLVMLLYNLFLYFSIKEKSYIYYVMYILFIGLTQTTITGYTYKFLWPDFPEFKNIAIIIFPALGGIFAILFFQDFLHTTKKSPLLHKIMNVIIGVYISAVVFRILGLNSFSYRTIDVAGITASLLAMSLASKLSFQGNRSAKFYLLACSMFLIGVVLYTLKNLNILPYNILTNYTMQAGTALEVMLFSIALADKINILKEQALSVSLENERIIREQNVLLERKVNERTVELTQANEEINSTLTKLKDAQTQLIDSEKMASLGQLTAGIAHEINNPINFVSSNIRPLRRDIDDLVEILDSYGEVTTSDTKESIDKKLEDIERLKDDLDVDYLKTELNQLLNGMEDGARRTVEIVKGLKIFSRVDESDLNFVNINEGIEATLVILNYQMGTNLNLVKELGSIPSIECYAGKLNQVFMNILTNAIFAVQNYPTNGSPTISVKTWIKDAEHVAISIRDNGPGMSPEVKAKIFDPFFTTKAVGQGTGLGLSIVFKIIDVHKGTIDVLTEVGKGTEFLITLPIKKQK